MTDEQEDVYVLDTSVMIRDPNVFFKLGRTRIFVPYAAVQELNGLQLSLNSNKSGAAKKAWRTLATLGCLEHIAFGAITPAGSQVRIFFRYREVGDLDGWADNKIAGVAMKLHEENPHYHVVLLTNDRYMLTVTKGHGIDARGYPFSNN